MKTYMPKGRQCRILQKLTCLMCANLSGETFFKKCFFSSKWLKTMLTRQISLLRSICRQYCAQIFFLSMIHVETRSQYQVCFILGMYVGRLVGRHLYVSWRGPYFNKKIFESAAKTWDFESSTCGDWTAGEDIVKCTLHPPKGIGVRYKFNFGIF